MATVVIREAKKNDCKAIMQLIKELAEYEKLPELVNITEEDLINDGFGDTQYFQAIVAEERGSVDSSKSGSLVGFVTYYYVYSTWDGRALKVEDVYVQPKYRSHGIGGELLKAVAKSARTKNCKRLELHVLDWNTPSIGFYKHLGMENLTEKEGWHIYRLDETHLIKLAGN